MKKQAKIYNSLKKVIVDHKKPTTSLNQILLATAELLVEPKATMAARTNWAALLVYLVDNPKSVLKAK